MIIGFLASYLATVLKGEIMELKTVQEGSGLRVTAGDNEVYFSTRDSHSQEWFEGNCGNGKVHEEEVTRWLLSKLESQLSFADVGAHLGWYSCLAASFGVYVHCFEANPLLIPLINENVTANGLEGKISVVNCAVSDEIGTISFPENSLKPGLTMGRGSTRVQSITLDEYFQGYEDIPDIFKIDVEGAETKALRGMLNIIRRRRPALMMEIHPVKLKELGSSHEEVLKILVNADYSIEIIGHQGGNGIVWATSRWGRKQDTVK